MTSAKASVSVRAITSDTTTKGHLVRAAAMSDERGILTTGLVAMIQIALIRPSATASNMTTAYSPGARAVFGALQNRAARATSSGAKSVWAARVLAMPPVSRPPMALGWPVIENGAAVEQGEALRIQRAERALHMHALIARGNSRLEVDRGGVGAQGDAVVTIELNIAGQIELLGLLQIHAVAAARGHPGAIGQGQIADRGGEVDPVRRHLVGDIGGDGVAAALLVHAVVARPAQHAVLRLA